MGWYGNVVEILPFTVTQLSLFSSFPLCCYFLYCCSSAIVDRCKCNLFMNHSTYLCEYTIWICLQYDFSWVNTAKDDLQTLLWIKGMIQSSLQSMGWLLLASRSLAQAPSQDFPFKGILACWLSVVHVYPGRALFVQILGWSFYLG